jgi:hypothetical protein
MSDSKYNRHMENISKLIAKARYHAIKADTSIKPHLVKYHSNQWQIIMNRIAELEGTNKYRYWH